LAEKQLAGLAAQFAQAVGIPLAAKDELLGADTKMPTGTFSMRV